MRRVAPNPHQPQPPNHTQTMFTTAVRFSARRAAVLATALAALAIPVAVSAAPADAAVGNPSGQLTVSKYDTFNSNVAVFGYIPMSQSEAQGLINSGHTVELRAYGEDTWSNDLLFNPYNAVIYATSRGLEFHRVRIGINNSYLNEDWGQDEVFVSMRLKLGSTVVRSGKTNVVRGYW